MMGERVLRITVKPFMDINTMIEERLTQCCVHVATVNATTKAHQCAPFCAVQAWAPLARTRLSTATGGRRELPVTRVVSASDFSGLNRYDETVGDPAPPFDPLRLCVYTTVAADRLPARPDRLLAFSGIAIAGYAKRAPRRAAALALQARRHPPRAASTFGASRCSPPSRRRSG